MSGLDGLQLDSDGFVDMDQFPDDGTDLAEADLAQLRDTLHADPVEEPTDAEWDAMFDEVLAADDTGPFAVDDVDPALADTDAGDDTGGIFGAEAGEAAADLSADDDASDVDAAEADLDDAAAAEVDDLDLEGSAADGVPADDLVYDDGGLDLAATDDGLDDAFATDAVDDVPTDIANNDFEDLV